jgi:hypothetical protein
LVRPTNSSPHSTFLLSFLTAPHFARPKFVSFSFRGRVSVSTPLLGPEQRSFVDEGRVTRSHAVDDNPSSSGTCTQPVSRRSHANVDLRAHSLTHFLSSLLPSSLPSLLPPSLQHPPPRTPPRSHLCRESRSREGWQAGRPEVHGTVHVSMSLLLSLTRLTLLLSFHHTVID